MIITTREKVIKACPYYDDIINSELADELSISIIDNYKNYILTHDQVEVHICDNIVGKYVNDLGFREYAHKNLENEALLIDKLKELYNAYEIEKLSCVRSTKWL